MHTSGFINLCSYTHFKFKFKSILSSRSSSSYKRKITPLTHPPIHSRVFFSRQKVPNVSNYLITQQVRPATDSIVFRKFKNPPYREYVILIINHPPRRLLDTDLARANSSSPTPWAIYMRGGIARSQAYCWEP